MRNPLWFCFWLIVLLVVSFVVALLGAVFYIFTYLFAQCCDCFRSVADFCLKCVQFPGYCAAAMLNCQSLC
ncbi:GH12209 [Drosophila grimshawi]|uniref:GH12209 n=1 Tax=Drosophila grimshawi TaxID=7222 RepID=B4JJP5_DROGR|nr:GH12209 [Drosophila grimshawi]